MSTNSGESGFCRYCDHSMNEHANKKSSQCKKCKKRFYICQINHMSGFGRKICNIPCGCGPKHYPDKAKSAQPLERVDYGPRHPQYESPPDESTWYEANPSTSETPASGPVLVEATKEGDLYKFTYDNKEITSYLSHWQSGDVDYQGKRDTYWMLKCEGILFIAWTLPTNDQQVSQRSHGKQAAYSHGRTASNSTDPLQWDDERIEVETQMASKMAELDLKGGGSNQVQDDRVRVYPRYYEEDMVEFKSNGKLITSMEASWKEVEDGHEFRSKTYGCTFFATEIKPPKTKK
ncbi:hypothetical protein DER44DRAFT_438403 [Fusarium oxysporum]|nr:hypothetical protein DER44DRAFT_438403 [Fusarium oxysporum]KAJ4031946.1 hypothetical protein NW763_014633 [Fusarium oxysporum]KAJ4041188.1 hypothetical protein NW753_010596 [Fusarium oxysporum]